MADSSPGLAATSDRLPVHLSVRDQAITYVMLLVILIFGTAIRASQMHESLWLDELHSSWVIHDGLSEFAERAAIGNQTPFYFGLPWASTRVFGESEWSMRLPSLVANLATIALVFWVVLRWTDSPLAGLVAAFVLSMDHHSIFYAQEARAYSLVQGLSLAHVFIFWRLQTTPDQRTRWSSIVLATLMFWTHYTSALIFLGEAIWYFALCSQGRTKYRFSSFVVDLTVFALAASPALPHLMAIAERRQNWALFVSRQSPWVAVEWFRVVPYGCVPFASFVILRLAERFRSKNFEQKILPSAGNAWSLSLCWLLIPVLSAWIMTEMDWFRLFFPRYLIGAHTALFVWIGLSIGSLRFAGSRWFASVIIVVFVLSDSSLLDQYSLDGRLLAERNQDWQGAAKYVSDHGNGTRPVLVRSGLLEADQLPGDRLLRDYSCLPFLGIYRIEREPPLIPLPTSRFSPLSAEDKGRIRSAGGFWLVVNGSRTAHERFAKYYQNQFRDGNTATRLKAQETFGQIYVARVSVQDSNE